MRESSETLLSQPLADFVRVRVVGYDPRTGSGAVEREDDGQRLTFFAFFAERGFAPMQPGEVMHAEVSAAGAVTNLIRMH